MKSFILPGGFKRSFQAVVTDVGDISCCMRFGITGSMKMNESGKACKTLY